MRLGSPLKNQTWEQGDASSIWPRLAAHFTQSDFHAALVANHAAVLHALVLAAQTFPVRHRTENLGAEQAIALGLEGAVIDGFRLGHLAVRPRANFLGTRQADANGIKIRDLTGAIIWLERYKGCPPVPAGPGQKTSTKNAPHRNPAAGPARSVSQRPFPAAVSAASSIRRPGKATATRGRAR